MSQEISAGHRIETRITAQLITFRLIASRVKSSRHGVTIGLILLVKQIIYAHTQGDILHQSGVESIGKVQMTHKVRIKGVFLPSKVIEVLSADIL